MFEKNLIKALDNFYSEIKSWILYSEELISSTTEEEEKSSLRKFKSSLKFEGLLAKVA